MLNLIFTYPPCEPNATNRCVHTEHCCSEHGCKYGDSDCPVALGKKVQSYPCESCSFDMEAKKDITEYLLKQSPEYIQKFLDALTEIQKKSVQG